MKATTFFPPDFSPPHDFIHLIQKNHLCSIPVHLLFFASLVFYYLQLSLSPSSFISLTGISFSLFLWGFSLSLKVISSALWSNSIHPEMLIFRLKATCCRDGKTDISLLCHHLFLTLFFWKNPCYPLLANPMEVKPQLPFAQVNVQPPQHEHKTNTMLSCVGDRSFSLSPIARIPLFLLHPRICFFLPVSLSLSLPASLPSKLDSGNITMLFSLFPSLWPNCLVFQDHWALFIGCSCNQSFPHFRAVSEQRWDQEMDSILQQIIQPQATDDCVLHTAHSDPFIKERVNKCSQEELW